MRKVWQTGLQKQTRTGGKFTGIHFPSEDSELLDWVNEQGQANKSYFIREALKSYRYLLGKYGQDWRDKI